jgi:hypothetical protein
MATAIERLHASERQKLTIAQILDDRQMWADAVPNAPEDLAVIEAEQRRIDDLYDDKIDKRGWMHVALKGQLRWYKQQAAIIRKRRKAIGNWLKRDRQYLADQMVKHGIEYMGGPTRSISRCKGKEKLFVNEEDLSGELRTVTVTMSLCDWAIVFNDVAECGHEELLHNRSRVKETLGYDKKAVEAELRRGPVMGAKYVEGDPYIMVK